VRFTPPSRLRVDVEDTGIGMSEEQVARLFRPFEQVGDPKHRSGGTGLGLAISRQFVRLMGGDIHVQSRLGAGNLFWFEIDVPAMKWTHPQPQAAQRIVTGYQGPTRKVLVVDDVAENRALLVTALERLGFDVIEASGGREGLALAQSKRPDLVLMDIVMPDLSGLEAITQLRAMPAFGSVPIIAISASVTSDVETKTLEVGADAFLSKPVDIQALVARAGSLLKIEWVESTERWATA